MKRLCTEISSDHHVEVMGLTRKSRSKKEHRAKFKTYRSYHACRHKLRSVATKLYLEHEYNTCDMYFMSIDLKIGILLIFFLFIDIRNFNLKVFNRQKTGSLFT